MSDLKTFALLVAECLTDASEVFVCSKITSDFKSSSEIGIVTFLSQYIINTDIYSRIKTLSNEEKQ